MQYTVAEINNNVAKIQFSDGTWTFLELNADMTEADLDDIVFTYSTTSLKKAGKPSFLSAGQTRTAAARPIEEAEEGGE